MERRKRVAADAVCILNFVSATLCVLGAGIFLAGCGGTPNTSGNASTPAILNIDSATTPTSPLNLPIEINGNGFQSAPGKVVFTQGNVSATVVPSTSGWSSTGIVAVVPAGSGTANFTLPGTVNVTVITSGGTSNAVVLNVIQTLTFSPSNMAWTTTMPLPTVMTGLRAVAVAGSTSSTAFAILTGGYNGSGNTFTVWANNLNADGTVGSATNTSWTTIPTAPLPDTRAHHAMAEADPTNSPVAANARFVYVIGGQKLATDAPGGTNTVFMASVDPTSGAVGAWQILTSTLPQALVGMSATVYNGFLYVAGGLTLGSTPSSAVYSAPIQSDGTLGTWTTAANSLPPLSTASFAEMFGFGGKLYFVNGDPNDSTTPNGQSVGTSDVNYSNVSHGVVGPWTLNPNLTIKGRAKAILFAAFGQVIFGEGVYNGSAGSTEFERSTVNADGTLASWNGLTGSTVPNANVYNCAGFVSPLISPAQTPRFLMFGGQKFASSGTGLLSNTVYVNSAP